MSSAVSTLPSTTAAFRFNPRSFALHRRVPERRRELLLRHGKQVTRERPRILPGEEPTGLERRPVRQCLREAHVPRARTLGGVPEIPFRDSVGNGEPNARKIKGLGPTAKRNLAHVRFLR